MSAEDHKQARPPGFQPNVVRVRDCFEANNTAYIVMAESRTASLAAAS